MREQQIRVTIVWGHRPPRRADVLLCGPGGTRWRDLLAPLGECLAEVDPDPDPGLARLPVPPQTLLGQVPLVEGAVIDLPGAPRRDTGGLMELRITNGPDCGRIVPLSPGRTLIGRSAHAHVRVDDPTSSRIQAEITMTADGVRLRECGSTNGTEVDGRRVRGSVRLRPGSVIRVGSSRLVLAVAEDPLVQAAPDVPREPQRFTEPPPPPATAPVAFAWLTVVLGLAVSGGLALFMRSPFFLLLGLAAPVLAVGQFVTDRRAGRRRRAADVAEHAAAVARVRERAAQAVAAERRHAWQRGDPVSVLQRLRGGWGAGLVDESRVAAGTLVADEAVVAGVGTVPSSVTLDAGDGPLALPMPQAPLLLDLARGPTLICGPREGIVRLARNLLGQWAVQNQAGHGRLLLVTDRPQDWTWLGWLPQTAPTARFARVLGRRMIACTPDQVARVRLRLTDPGAAEDVLVVWDHSSPRPPSLVRAVVLAAIPAPAQPPPGTGTLATVDALGRLRLTAGGLTRTGTADLVGPGWAEQVGRALAASSQGCAEPSGEPPADVRLPDLLGEIDAVAVAERWSRPGAPVVPLGMSAAGPVLLDLRTAGPHLLVAGTTGAGKSALLRTLVAGLAAGNRPDDLAVLLIDYKGGAAFGACRDLPHTVGLVTDLDAALTGRALRSLRAEITRREKLLADLGAADLQEYRVLSSKLAPGAPRLARLVIVVDEFRALVEDLPDFVTGLVRLAGVGRSLGLHLVLATQRPAGVISAEIRANITTRIALRTADQIESRDVIDSPLAAAIPTSAAGRAVLRIGAEPPVPLQVARVDLSTPQSRPRARLCPFASLGDLVDRDAHRSAGAPSDLGLLVASARQVCRQESLPPARRVWWPPLPETVTVADLARWPVGPPAAADALVIGLRDEPASQWQGPCHWRATGDGPLAIVGEPGSGRRTTARALLSQARARGYTTAVLEADDPEAALTILRAPPALLFVGDWEDVQRWRSGPGDLYDRLLEVIRGRNRRTAIVVTGGRALLTSTVAASFTSRLVLRLSDPVEAGMAGLPRGDLPSPWPPGRGFFLTPRLSLGQVQVALAEPAGHRQGSGLDDQSHSADNGDECEHRPQGRLTGGDQRHPEREECEQLHGDRRRGRPAAPP